MSGFAGQVVVVTGGETGIGLGAVRELAAAGAQVVIGGILEDKGAEAAERIRADGGLVEYRKTDVRCVDQVERLVDSTVERFGRIDGLVNSAAIFDGFASCTETSDHLWEQVININLRGTFYACRAALRHMVPAKRGKIVNISSVGGLVGAADGASYTASKHAVVGLTKQIACDYAKFGIQANAVCPGSIDTDVRGNSARILGPEAPGMGGVGADPDWLKRLVPAQRKGTASEVADLILFLLSERSAYIVGQALVVDGGWTAK